MATALNYTISPFACSLDPQVTSVCDCYLQGFPSYCWDSSDCQPVAPVAPVASPAPGGAPSPAAPHAPVRPPTGKASSMAHSWMVSVVVAVTLVLVAVAY